MFMTCYLNSSNERYAYFAHVEYGLLYIEYWWIHVITTQINDVLYDRVCAVNEENQNIVRLACKTVAVTIPTGVTLRLMGFA